MSNTIIVPAQCHNSRSPLSGCQPLCLTDHCSVHGYQPAVLSALPRPQPSNNSHTTALYNHREQSVSSTTVNEGTTSTKSSKLISFGKTANLIDQLLFKYNRQITQFGRFRPRIFIVAGRLNYITPLTVLFKLTLLVDFKVESKADDT
ncbi:hypothetical protein J6590_017401 [Homalodisca vitripennis]|nr:hypothetical protein J6590_017401 [Homalodisca vitripennis]